jgi:hypothetical protein
VSVRLHAAVAGEVHDRLEAFHSSNPLLEGEDLAGVRATVAARIGTGADPDLVGAMLADLERRGELAREGSTVRLASHRVTLSGHEEEVARLVEAVAAGEPTRHGDRPGRVVGADNERGPARHRAGHGAHARSVRRAVAIVGRQARA